MSFVIVFSLGYLLGGVTAAMVLGFTIAARNGDRADEGRSRDMYSEDVPGIRRKHL